MTPLDKGESVSKYVARSIDIIDQSGVDYQLNSMGTVLEGEWDEVMAVVKDCYEKMNSDCNRISCSIKIDARSEKDGRLTKKIDSIQSTLGREVKS